MTVKPNDRALIPVIVNEMEILFSYLCLILLWSLVHGRHRSISSGHPTGNPTFQPTTSPYQWWSVPDTLFHAQNQTMFLRYVNADEGKIHSCYEYKLFDYQTNRITKLNTFCFPSIVIIGYRKCSTSALFALISSHPQALMKINAKENCPFDGRRELDAFFDSLPNNVSKNRMIVNGCIYLPKIMDVLDVLRNPNTFYLVCV